MKAALVLAIAFVIACADQHDGTEEQHNEDHEDHRASLCDLNLYGLATVLDCIHRNITDEIRGKLAAVSERLQCDDIYWCPAHKFWASKLCQEQDTLEGMRTDVFTTEENTKFINALIGCKPQQVIKTEDPAEQASQSAAMAKAYGRALSGCAPINLNAETAQKVRTLKEQYHCGDLHCVITRVYEGTNRTLEDPSDKLSEAERTDMRAAALICHQILERLVYQLAKKN